MFSLLSRLDSRCFYLFTLALLASTCGGFRIVSDTASPINRFALPPDYPSSIGANVVSSYPFDSENDRSLQMPKCCVIEPTQMEPDHRHIVYPEKPLDGLLRSVPSIQMRSDQDRMNVPLGNSTEKLLDGLNEKLRVNAQVIGDSFEQDIVAIADRDPTEQDSMTIEEDAILSSISAITPPDESGDNELNYAASFRGDVKECGHDFIEAAVAHTLASSTTNATLDTNYAIYCSVRNNATRAGYGLISIVFVIAMFLFLLPTTFAMDCPNEKFKPIASYKANFDLSTLSQKDLYYWLAFGSNGRWSLAMITAKDLTNAKPIDQTNTFKCDEFSWGSVSAINTEDELSVPICCISPCSIDEEQKDPQTQSFAVLPSKLHENLKHYNDKVSRPTRKTGQISLVWKLFPKEIRMAYKQGHDDYDNKPGPPETLLAANTHYATCPSTKWCDTGIVNDIVMFLMDRGQTRIRFAYSTDGIFNLETFIDSVNAKRVRYTSVLSLFDSMDQPHPSYGVSSADWVLGSFCASCPSTSMTIQITKQDAAMNKKRFEHAFSVGIKGVGVSGGYSYKNIQETSKTLTNGQATTIKAECNAFYLWHYTLSIGTWGTGNAVIPTQLFYCSDRQNPPICKPRISKQHTDDTCDGHDIASDFGEKDKGPPWTSMHAGRPRPIRLQGQALGKNGREPSFEVSNPIDVAAYLQKNVHIWKNAKQKQELLNKLKANNKARSSSFGDLLYLDGDNAKRKSLIDQYDAASRFIEKAHHYGHQSGSKSRLSQGNEFPLLRRKYRK